MSKSSNILPPQAGVVACANLAIVPRNFLTFDALKARGLFNNRVSLARAIKHYGFPRPFTLGARRVAWDEDEVNSWVESRRA